MAKNTGSVQTVLGPIDPAHLGHTQTHEHLLSDLSSLIELPTSASQRSLLNADITLSNRFSIQRHGLNIKNAQLTDEREVADELHTYRASGGGSIVESTPINMGRDPEGLARLSRESGVNVVMGSGYYVAKTHPADFNDLSEDAIAQQIINDCLFGVGVEAVRPGVIGEIGLSWPLHPSEDKVLRAATRAQVETGLPLQIHPGRNPQAPLDALRVVSEAGGHPERVIMSHVDRTLFTVDEMRIVANSGCYLEFDLFGHESSHYHRGDIDMPNDAIRIDYLMRLSELGFENSLLVSQDICYRVHFTKYGGEGYSYILRDIRPMMMRKGMTVQDVERLCVDNPRDILTVL